MLRTLRSSVAILAATAALASPLAAQTVPGTPAAPAAPSASAPAPAAPVTAPVAALPSALTELGISDARLHEGRRGGQRAEGTLPGGQRFHAMLDEQSQLRMIGVEGEGALPADIVSRLVPEGVRANAIFAEFTQLRGIGRGEEGVMLFGTDAQGEEIRAGFSADGRLQRFGRGDMDRPGMEREGDRHGKREGDRDHGRKHGDAEGRGHPERDSGRRGLEAARDAGGPRPEGAAAPLDDAAIQGVLRDAGYTQPGAITRNGPRTEVEAVNPEGEPVTVTVNPRGVVVRELAR